MADRFFIKDYLDQYFDEIAPKDFYRNIFPIGELEEKGKQVEGKYNAIAIELKPKEENKVNIKKYLIFDQLEALDELVKSDNFIIISPISYIGMSRQSKNARFIYAMAIDLDGITEQHYLVDLFYQIEIDHLPKPTYVVWSGTGLHLYYQFESAIPCFKNIVRQLQELKKALTKKIWNMYVSELYKKPQIESLFQGFRLVGGVTKAGNRTKAYITGEKITVSYLNEFVDEKYQVKEITYKSKLTLKEAASKYPEWYKKRIVENKPKVTWENKRALYDWWKRKINENITEGHRYYGIMVLSIYAKKCGIDREELEKDAFGYIERLEHLTITEDNHFTREDVMAALEMYNDNYITFPIHSIVSLTAIPIQKNKRNYRKREIHLEYARGIKELKKKLGEDVSGGRKSKKEDIIKWKKENPCGTIKQCIEETNISKSTVYKYWKAGE